MIQLKIRQKLSLQQVLKQAASSAFDPNEITVALSILSKFSEHFFLKSTSLTDKNEEAKMGQSFYRKDGLDYLAFSYSEAFQKTNLRVFNRADKLEQ